MFGLFENENRLTYY